MLLSRRKSAAPAQMAEKVERRYAGTEKEELSVDCSVSARGDIAEQQDGQQHLERQLVDLRERLFAEKVPAAQQPSEQDDRKDRHGRVQTKY